MEKKNFFDASRGAKPPSTKDTHLHKNGRRSSIEDVQSTLVPEMHYNAFNMSQKDDIIQKNAVLDDSICKNTTKHVDKTKKNNTIPKIKWLKNISGCYKSADSTKHDIFRDLPSPFENLSKNEKNVIKNIAIKKNKEESIENGFRLIKNSTQPDAIPEKIVKQKNTISTVYKPASNVKKYKADNKTIRMHTKASDNHNNEAQRNKCAKNDVVDKKQYKKTKPAYKKATELLDSTNKNAQRNDCAHNDIVDTKQHKNTKPVYKTFDDLLAAANEYTAHIKTTKTVQNDNKNKTMHVINKSSVENETKYIKYTGASYNCSSYNIYSNTNNINNGVDDNTCLNKDILLLIQLLCSNKIPDNLVHMTIQVVQKATKFFDTYTEKLVYNLLDAYYESKYATQVTNQKKGDEKGDCKPMQQSASKDDTNIYYEILKDVVQIMSVTDLLLLDIYTRQLLVKILKKILPYMTKEIQVLLEKISRRLEESTSLAKMLNEENTTVKTVDDGNKTPPYQDIMLPVEKKRKLTLAPEMHIKKGRKVLEYLMNDEVKKFVLVDLVLAKKIRNSSEAQSLLIAAYEGNTQDVAMTHEVGKDKYLCLVDTKILRNSIQTSGTSQFMRLEPWTVDDIATKKILLAEALSNAKQKCKNNMKKEHFAEYLNLLKQNDMNAISERIIAGPTGTGSANL